MYNMSVYSITIFSPSTELALGVVAFSSLIVTVAQAPTVTVAVAVTDHYAVNWERSDSN